jgi:hypothetical protein
MGAIFKGAAAVVVGAVVLPVVLHGGHHHGHGTLVHLLGSGSPVHVHAPASANEALAKRMAARAGWTGRRWACLDELWMHESAFKIQWNHAGSGAFGIPQALPGSKMASAGADWATNPATQVRWGLSYIRERWHDPCHIWGEYCTATPDHPEYANGQPLGCWY